MATETMASMVAMPVTTNIAMALMALMALTAHMVHMDHTATIVIRTMATRMTIL